MCEIDSLLPYALLSGTTGALMMITLLRQALGAPIECQT